MFHKAKAFLDREISSLEPLVESYTQFHVMLYLYITAPKCFGISGGLSFSFTLFVFKLALSFYGFIVGAQNFLMNGPFCLFSDWSSFLGFKKGNGFILNAVMLIFWPLKWMRLFLVTMHIYLMSLNGGFNLGFGGKQTFLLVFGITYSVPAIFSLCCMVTGIGIIPSIKVVLRYPAVVVEAVLDGCVYSHFKVEYCCYLKRGDTIRWHIPLTSLNHIIMIVLSTVNFSLPRNDRAIITECDDGSNLFSGLQLNAKQMTTITAVIWTLAGFSNFVVTALTTLPIKTYMNNSESKYGVLEIKSLDDYKCVEEEEEPVIEITHL